MPEDRGQARGRGGEEGACIVIVWGHPAVRRQLARVYGPQEGFSRQGKQAALGLCLTLCPSMSLAQVPGWGLSQENFLGA